MGGGRVEREQHLVYAAEDRSADIGAIQDFLNDDGVITLVVDEKREPRARGPVSFWCDRVYGLMASVTPFWLLAVPTVIITGTLVPVATPAGTVALTCNKPATKSGAAPAY